MPDKQLIIDQAARIVKPGGKVMFTDWIEGEGLSDQEAQQFLSLMTFPAIPTVEEYAQMMKKANFKVEIAQNSGRYSAAMDSYLHMLKLQAVYDAKKLLSWDVAAYDKLISDFEFMAKLAKEGKILQGMFVGRKLEGPKHEMWRKHSDQARHFPKSSLRHFAHTLKPWRAYERYIVWSWKDWGIRFHSSQSGSFAECFRVCDF